MILNDIMEQFDIEDNFQYCFTMYCNHLEKEGKWKLCEDNSTKNNYKYRMRKQYKGDLDRNREWNKFENWIEKKKVAEQKEVERRAIKLNRGLEEKYKKLLEDYETLKKDYETLKEKYFRECDSDYSSDDEPIEKIS